MRDRLGIPTKRRTAAIAALGVIAEVVLLLPFSDLVISTIKPGEFVGVAGALAVAPAALTAFLAGPFVGGLVALAGWAFFFPFIVEGSVNGLVPLPIWLGIAVLIGVLADRLRNRERQLARMEAERLYAEHRRGLANQAHHEVRTPATVIYGMAEMLLRDDLKLTAKQRREFLRMIADSAARLEDVPGRLGRHEEAPQPRP